jgi:2-dehydro-3-deoxy-D-arabinonate dehydratase
MTALWRVEANGERRLALGAVDEGPARLLDPAHDLDALLAEGGPSLHDIMGEAGVGAVPDDARVLAPLGSQEVWASGVTYLRSRDARMAESDAPDFYDRVYDADRPELFFKATAERVRGPGDPIAVRADSTWDVPEPELGVVADASGRIVAATIGNDVSSRSIEGENPLYLPQAKTYTGSCALGPCLIPVTGESDLGDCAISIAITRDGRQLYGDEVSTSQMKRTPHELVAWLFRALDFPRGVVLMTGTALVPDDDVSLEPGDLVTIGIEGFGQLVNTVEQIGGNP